MDFLIVHFVNFFTAQGSSEPHHLYHFLRGAENHSVRAIVPGKGEDPDRVEGFPRQRSRLWSWAPYLLYADLQALRVAHRMRFDSSPVIWVYRGFFLTPLYLKIRTGGRLVVDLRAPPVEQDLEFHRARGTLDLKRRVYYRAMRWILRPVLRGADKVVVVSRALERFMREQYGVPSEKLQVLTLGVDLDRFEPGCDREFGEGGIRIVYLTSIALHRGIGDVVRALSILRDRGLRPELHIVGSGRQRDIEAIKGQREYAEVRNQVKWLGRVPHEEVPALLRKYDIGLSPLPDLLPYRLSSPTKVFEYLSVSLPVVASDIEAHREIIIHGENGLLVPPSDPEGYASAIERLCTEEELREKIEGNARGSIADHGWERMLTDLLESLEQDFRADSQ